MQSWFSSILYNAPTQKKEEREKENRNIAEYRYKPKIAANFLVLEHQYEATNSLLGMYKSKNVTL